MLDGVVRAAGIGPEEAATLAWGTCRGKHMSLRKQHKGVAQVGARENGNFR